MNKKIHPLFLKRMKLESFGDFSHKIVGSFKPQLNVVYGKNEAGKTTLNAFFTGVLFGWEDARGMRNTYKPKNAERAGTLFFENSETGEEIEFTRIKNTDGLEGPTSLLSDIDKDTYTTMFGLTSDELRSLKNTSDVTAKLLTAGSGTNASPAQALTDLQSRITEYNSRASGIEHSITQLKQHQEELREAVAVAVHETDCFKKEDREFHEIEPRRNDFLQKIEALNSEIEKLTAHKITLERIEKQEEEALLQKDDLLLQQENLLREKNEQNYAHHERFVTLSPAEEYALRERIDVLQEEQTKAEQRVSAARDTYAESKASYEALLEADDVQELEINARNQKRLQITLSVVLPLGFIGIGVLLLLYGRDIGSLSIITLGIGLVAFSILLASAALVMLFRPNKADEALVQRKKDTQWVMLQDKKKLEALGLELNEHVAKVRNYLDQEDFENAQGSLRRARTMLDEAKDVRAQENLIAQKQQAISSQIKSCESVLQDAQNQRHELAQQLNIRQEITMAVLEDLLETRMRQRSTLNETSAKINRRYGELKTELSHARHMTKFDELKLEYAQVETRILDSSQELARLLLAKRMLEVAIGAWESKSQPEVYKQASRLLSDMTGGKWIQVRMSPEGRLQVIDEVKTVREPLHLSLGTCQQLYLSLRISLLMTAENVGRIIPIMADDILVNFDEERREGAICALQELSQKRQVILFTSHREIVRLMQTIDSSTNVVEL